MVSNDARPGARTYSGSVASPVRAGTPGLSERRFRRRSAAPRARATPSGAVVIPAHNAYNPIIAYLGVLPDQRGKGYIDDILSEGTRVLAENNALRIRASTDLDNVPMANAFERSGYIVFQRQIDMTWDKTL